MTATYTPVLDGAALERLRRLGGDTLATRMIDLFLENAARRVEAARGGVTDGDLDATARAAHSLKSSAANVGAVRLQQLAEKVERVAEEGDAESVGVLLTALEEAHRNARVELAAARDGVPA